MVFEVFEFQYLHLLAWKKFEDAFELTSVQSSLEVGKTARFNRRRAGSARFFFSNRIEEIERFAASVSLHIPVRKGTLHRITQENQQFDLWIVIPNPLHCRFVIDVTRCAITRDRRWSNRRIMLVQFLIIGLRNEHRVVIEKMDFLLIAHANIGMSA